jgi:hypothetical protein
MSEEDLLAGGDTPENPEGGQPQDPGVEPGPPPSSVQMPDWVPPEYHDPGKRDELLKALGVETGRQLPTERPDYVPEKFWKDDEGLQIENLAKSYGELERKLHETGKIAPENYEIRPPEGVKLDEDESFLSDEDIELFKELGLNNEQAQKVTDYYWENALPALLEERAQSQHATLAAQWNMKPGEDGKMPSEYKQRLSSIKNWAEQNLPAAAVESLRTSASGIKAMWEMMQTNTQLPSSSETGVSGMSDAEIQRIMNSDEYWDPGNEKIRQQVEQEILRRTG